MINDLSDSEEIYRRVEFDPMCFEQRDGSLMVTSTAFNDRNNQPSVDRAVLCNFDPLFTQGDDQRAGVILLRVKDVRNIGLNKEGKEPVTYAIDVFSDPIPKDHPTLPENPAHAEIRASPGISSNNVFRRLRKSLAFIANQYGWKITPDGNR